MTFRHVVVLIGIVVLSVGAGVAVWILTPSPPEAVTVHRQAYDSGPPGSPFGALSKPRPLPELRFVDGEGRPLSLKDFRGRTVLLNIWATWCIPCRKEMPSLDRLQAAFDKSKLLVLPLSIDQKGAAVVLPFYRELGLKSLGIYIDTSGRASFDLNALGVPTTLLIDREGREIGRRAGAVEWDRPETIAFFRKQLGLPAQRQQAASP